MTPGVQKLMGVIKRNSKITDEGNYLKGLLDLTSFILIAEINFEFLMTEIRLTEDEKII
jgi:hypothetical protein